MGRHGVAKTLCGLAVVVACLLLLADAEKEMLLQQGFGSSFDGVKADWLCTDSAFTQQTCAVTTPSGGTWAWKHVVSTSIGNNGMETCTTTGNNGPDGNLKQSKDAQNWLVTPGFSVLGLTKIHVAFAYNMATCSTSTCLNHLAINAFQVSNETVLPDVTADGYPIGTVAGTYTFSSASGKSDTLSTVDLSFNLPSGVSFLRVGWFDAGGCVRLDDVQIYYDFCPETNIGGVLFPKTISINEPVFVSGTCDIGVPENKNIVCSPTGAWSYAASAAPFCLTTTTTTTTTPTTATTATTTTATTATTAAGGGGGGSNPGGGGGGSNPGGGGSSNLGGGGGTSPQTGSGGGGSTAGIAAGAAVGAVVLIAAAVGLIWYNGGLACLAGGGAAAGHKNKNNSAITPLASNPTFGASSVPMSSNSSYHTMAGSAMMGMGTGAGAMGSAVRAQAPLPQGLNVSYSALKQSSDLGDREYEDPSMYEDPADLLEMIREIAKQFPRSAVRQLQTIGSGEFGEVWHAQVQTDKGFVDCAVKTCHAGSGRNAKLEFLQEAAIMGQFHHPNVLSLLGVVIEGEPVLLITELMTQGSLSRYLLTHMESLNVAILLGMAVDCASGMAYLASKGFVHRDLAARNILIAQDGHCKVADFGLSKAVDDDSDYFISEGGKIPIRWTAPEAVVDRKYTSSSDVWSYGILCWEIFSFGARPYDNMTNIEVVKKVDTGYRLPKPAQCPVTMYEILLDCWQLDRKARPSFVDLHKSVKSLKEEIEGCGDYSAFEEPVQMARTDKAGYLIPTPALGTHGVQAPRYDNPPAKSSVSAATSLRYDNPPSKSSTLRAAATSSHYVDPLSSTGSYDSAINTSARLAPTSTYDNAMSSGATSASASQNTAALPVAATPSLYEEVDEPAQPSLPTTTVMWEYKDSQSGVTIPKNTSVTVVDASHGEWTLVQLGGQQLYVPASYLSQVHSTEA